MPYLSCKKIENDVYNFPTWQYCKYKDIFDSRIIINSTAKFYISISYQKDLLSIDTRIFTPSFFMVFFLLFCFCQNFFISPKVRIRFPKSIRYLLTVHHSSQTSSSFAEPDCILLLTRIQELFQRCIYAQACFPVFLRLSGLQNRSESVLRYVP